MIQKNNGVIIAGKVVSELVFNHKIYGEKFYKTYISSRRLSGIEDVIPVLVSEKLLDAKKIYLGQGAFIDGRFQSYNRKDGERSKLILNVFANEIQLLDDKQEDFHENEIYLDGFICKEPVYRKTPLGREIANVLIAVNRDYKKSDYIPCIFWGEYARFVSGLGIGERLLIKGRIQSREYQKKVSDDEFETRTAYEVSASIAEVAESEGQDENGL